MRKILNFYFLFIFAFIGVGCSSFSEKIDIAGIIDSTENWLFSEDGNISEDEEETIKKSSNEEKEEEEVFPDITDIPQERPNFEELDKSFFDVQCGRNALRIFNVQLEGKKAMDSKDFIVGYQNLDSSILL